MAAATSSSSNVPPATVSTSSDGPVLTLINKRLRAYRKKHNRITQTEESLLQGKTLNSEQQELLRSKSSVLCYIEELEKLRDYLPSAVSEEISLALSSQNQALLLSPLNRAPEVERKETAEGEEENGKRSAVVEDLLGLLYFGSLFDVMPQNEFTSLMLTRTHERGCCLTYDYVTDDVVDLLGERDLDLISAFKGLLISRPVDSSLSHKNALSQCIDHAKLWIAKSDSPVHPDSDVTYAGLRGKLEKIMSSDYYTATPEIKAAVEMAAAAAAGNFGPFQVPFDGSIMPDSLSVQVDGSVGHYQNIEEKNTHEEFQNGEDQSDPVDALPKVNLGAKEPLEGIPTQSDTTKQQADMEENPRDVEPKEQQHAPWTSYQNQRGGRGSGNGRRGYPNGRGGRGGRGSGGPHQNGRNQYYDQSGNYYPRNYYNRGRGWHSASGNNYGYNGSAASGGPAQENVGGGLIT